MLTAWQKFESKFATFIGRGAGTLMEKFKEERKSPYGL